MNYRFGNFMLKKLIDPKKEITGIKRLLSLFNHSFNLKIDRDATIDQFDLKGLFASIGENLISSLRRDFTDFHRGKDFSIFTPENSNIRISKDRLTDLMDGFTELSSMSFVFLDYAFNVIYSYMEINSVVIYNISVWMDGFLLVDKLETNFNNRFIKDSLIKGCSIFDGDKFILLNSKEATYFYRSSTREYLSIVYDEDFYFNLISRLALVKD